MSILVNIDSIDVSLSLANVPENAALANNPELHDAIGTAIFDNQTAGCFDVQLVTDSGTTTQSVFWELEDEDFNLDEHLSGLFSDVG